jgi:putative membrane protein
LQRLILSAALLLPVPALAHTPAVLATDWITWVLALSLLGYLYGVRRAMQRPAAARVALFLCGWALLAATLLGPIALWAHATLVGHMTQHMLLLAVVPPLLLLARPMPQYMQALNGDARRRAGPWLGRLYKAAATTPMTAFVVHGVVIWLWHLPVLYQLAAAHRALHDVAHLSFFVTGLWFWWSLIAPGRLGHARFGTATVLAVLTMMHTGMLGALMTFAPQVLYPDHPAGFRGFDSLSDQQLAGLVMWVPGGLVYASAALALAILWLKRMPQ